MTEQKQQQYTYIHIRQEKALYQKCCCVIPIQLVSYLCHKKPLPRSSRWYEHRGLHLPRPTPSHLENTTYRYSILPLFFFFWRYERYCNQKEQQTKLRKKDKTTTRGGLGHHCLGSLRNSNSNNNKKKTRISFSSKRKKKKEKRGVQLMVKENS